MRTLHVTASVIALACSFHPAAAATVAEVVFGAGLFREVEEPAIFQYGFTLRGQDVEPDFHSRAVMDVRKVAPDGQKEVFFELFEGAQQRSFGPMQAKEHNPLILVFLQRDVTQMANLTGGSANYFQQQIRRAMTNDVEAAEIEVEVDGEWRPATRIGIRPFQNDPSIQRFPKFRDKLYAFTISDHVPGGLYQLELSVPDPETGTPILNETLTFESVERPAP